MLNLSATPGYSTKHLPLYRQHFSPVKKKKKKDWYSRAQSSSISTGKLKKNKKYCSWISKETLHGILGMSDNGADLEVQHSHSSWPRAETEVHVELAV